MKHQNSKHKSIFTEYNLNLEYESFSSRKFKSDTDNLNCFSFRPRELSISTQYLAMINRNKNLMMKNSNEFEIALNLRPMLFDRILFNFYVFTLNRKAYVFFVFIAYALIVGLFFDFFQGSIWYLLTKDNFFIELGIRNRLSLSTVISYYKVILSFLKLGREPFNELSMSVFHRF